MTHSQMNLRLQQAQYVKMHMLYTNVITRAHSVENMKDKGSAYDKAMSWFYSASRTIFQRRPGPQAVPINRYILHSS